MIRGMYASTAGMVAMMARVQTVANNLANVETAGFKEETLSLKTPPAAPVMRLAGANLWPAGDAAVAPVVGSMVTGLLSDGTTIRFTQGALQATDSPLDVALDGAGFFAVQTAEGVRYTRDGGFRRDGAGQLVTARGDAVLNPAGQPIVVPAGEVAIWPGGELRVDGAPAGQIGVFDFPDPRVLRKAGANLLAAPAGAAPPTPAAATVHQGYLEHSNVDPTRAVAELLVAQRAYEAGARLVQAQDAMTGRAVNDVGRV